MSVRLSPPTVASAVAAVLALASVASSASAQSTRPSGIDTTNFDRSVRPQDDLFRFVNGGWIKKTPIPSDAPSWGAFYELDERSRESLRAILEQAAKSNAPAGSEERKVGDYYASFLDSARVEAQGVTPLKGELARIAALKSHAELPALFAHLARVGVARPVAVGVSTDPKKSTENTVIVGQSGLSLPDRDYYLLNDARMASVRKSYSTYLTQLFTLAELPDAAGAASRVIALETAIAGKQWERARNRDRNAVYNPRTVVQLGEAMPGFDWKSYLGAAGLGAVTNVIVQQPDYLVAIDSIIKATPVATWREYFAAKLLDTYSPELSSPFVQARFDFRGKVLSGQQEQRARWKRGVTEVELGLGDAAGKLYVARHFKPEAKARMDSLIRNLRAAYSIGIDSLEWMSAGHQGAREGQALEVHGEDRLSGQVARLLVARGASRRPGRQRHARRASGRTPTCSHSTGSRWTRCAGAMTPQTVNAYYSSTQQRDRLSGRDPAAAVLRSHRGRCGELRRDRRRHRPRDRPRLRRPGAQVGRRRQPARLVDPRGREGVRGAREQAGRAVRSAQRRSRGRRSTRS